MDAAPPSSKVAVTWVGVPLMRSSGLSFFYTPLIPIRPVHTFGWSGVKYRQIPIRWSAALVARSFLRGWNWLPIAAGCVLLLIGCTVFTVTAPEVIPERLVMLALGGMLAAAGVILYFVLRATDQRTNAIRRILGPNQLGSCDPAAMQQPMQPDPREVYGTDCYGDAVPALLDAERYSRAMWAARLSMAWEDRAFGEELTDQILHHPGVAEAVEQVRRKPKSWAEFMLSPTERQARQRQA
jgi:hypothetical protein